MNPIGGFSSSWSAWSSSWNSEDPLRTSWRISSFDFSGTEVLVSISPSRQRLGYLLSGRSKELLVPGLDTSLWRDEFDLDNIQEILPLSSSAMFSVGSDSDCVIFLVIPIFCLWLWSKCPSGIKTPPMTSPTVSPNSCFTSSLSCQALQDSQGRTEVTSSNWISLSSSLTPASSSLSFSSTASHFSTTWSEYPPVVYANTPANCRLGFRFYKSIQSQKASLTWTHGIDCLFY